MEGFLICPEFLPAVARLAARAGLSLVELLGCPPTDLAPTEGSKEEPQRRFTTLRAASSRSDDKAVCYVAEQLLQEEVGSNALGEALAPRAEEPKASVRLASVQHEDLGRLAVPGALLVGLDPRRLARERGEVYALDVTAAVEAGKAEGEVPGRMDAVICEVIYDRAPAGSSTPRLPSTIRVEAVSCPTAAAAAAIDDAAASGAATIARAEASAAKWAEEICQRHAGAVFVAPEHHAVVARLLDNGVSDNLLADLRGNAFAAFSLLPILCSLSTYWPHASGGGGGSGSGSGGAAASSAAPCCAGCRCRG